jgi:1,2-diacylglycerol 3-beta-galactosyltransferase
MAMADFFIGKPGPGCISEALAMGLPVIVEHNAWTLVQERYNTEWIVERDVGIVTSDFSRIAEAVGRLLAPERFARCRANVAALRNFAVYEVPAMLEVILARHAHVPVFAAHRAAARTNVTDNSPSSHTSSTIAH